MIPENKENLTTFKKRIKRKKKTKQNNLICEWLLTMTAKNYIFHFGPSFI